MTTLINTLDHIRNIMQDDDHSSAVTHSYRPSSQSISELIESHADNSVKLLASIDATIQAAKDAQKVVAGHLAAKRGAKLTLQLA